MTDEAVRAIDGGLTIGQQRLPLIVGEVQFWRMERDSWAAALDSVVALGIPVVSTYLSWRRHEPREGEFEWGDSDPTLDAAAFLRLCSERGIRVILKPGPWICAEEPGGGYPDWMTAHHEEMARSAGGALAQGYDAPFLHPVPSVHSPWYRQVAARWLHEVWDELREFVHPAGPIIAVQLDNEPSVAFQDALYFADYHPRAVAAFRDWLARRYQGDVGAWQRAWGEAASSGFANAQPPRPATDEDAAVALIGRVEHPTPHSRAAIHDWTLFLESSLTDHLAWIWEVHRAEGCGGLLPTVNIIPNAVHEAPLSHRRVREALGGRAAVGVDHYYDPPMGWNLVDTLARTAASARAAGEPVVWAPEMMAGIWRTPGQVVDYPDPSPTEQAAWWGAAVALGYQGLNFYMLADRENWQYAPISASGGLTEFAEPLRSLVALLSSGSALLRARPLSAVTVLWDREDALDAYSTVGTMRSPGVPWARPELREAYDATTRLTLALLRHGHVYELWDPRADGEPAAGAVVVIPENKVLDPSVRERLDAAGCRLITVPEGAELAEVIPVAPSARLLGTGEGSHDLAVIHRGEDGRLVLHVVQWGAVPEEGRARLLVAPEVLADQAGSWVQLGGDGQVLRPRDASSWDIVTQAGHRVFEYR